MLGRTKPLDSVKENAEIAARLARDKKFRKQLISAIGHSAKARRTVRSRTSLVPVVARLASDRALRAELESAVDDLRKAWGRVQRKRSHKGRNVALAAVAVAGAAAVARELFGRKGSDSN
jgi:hypothetical protein